MLIALFGGRPSPLWLVVAITAAALALAIMIGVLRVRTGRLVRSSPPPTAEEMELDKKIGRRFGWVFGLEGAAILIAVVMLNAAGRGDYVICAIALIVGIHFLPLASLFEAPVYYMTGVVGTALGLLGVFVTDVPTRLSVVGIGFVFLLWLTIAIILARVFPLLSQRDTSRPNAAN